MPSWCAQRDLCWKYLASRSPVGRHKGALTELLLAVPALPPPDLHVSQDALEELLGRSSRECSDTPRIHPSIPLPELALQGPPLRP